MKFFGFKQLAICVLVAMPLTIFGQKGGGLMTRVEALESAVAELTSDLQAEREARQTLEGKVNGLMDQVGSMNAQLSEMGVAVAALQALVGTYESRMSAM